jgi:methylenetetrahydrofolate dehydrogenase (NADP+)/methenyltetrahydrofolate cyclohydrolase
MATRLDGRQLAATIEERLQAVVAQRLERAGRPPGLAVLRVGDDPASGVYVANKEKACSRIGIINLGAHLPADTPAAEVLSTRRSRRRWHPAAAAAAGRPRRAAAAGGH